MEDIERDVGVTMATGWAQLRLALSDVHGSAAWCRDPVHHAERFI